MYASKYRHRDLHATTDAHEKRGLSALTTDAGVLDDAHIHGNGMDTSDTLSFKLSCWLQFNLIVVK